jgi:hypothetical protein
MKFKKAILKIKQAVKNFKYKGPFGVFISRIKHAKEIKAEKRLEELYKDACAYIKEWTAFSRVRIWDSVKSEKECKKGEARFLQALSTDDSLLDITDKMVHDSILNYFIFKQLPEEDKQKFTDLYYKRQDMAIPEGFSSDFVRMTEPQFIKKSAFTIWMNHYLKNNVSTEILEFDNFELALKLGDTWNNLSIDERNRWKQICKEEREKKKSIINAKKFKKVDNT